MSTTPTNQTSEALDTAAIEELAWCEIMQTISENYDGWRTARETVKAVLAEVERQGFEIVRKPAT